MEPRTCTKPRRTTPHSARNKRAGLTLIELLVTLALFLVVLTIAFNAFAGGNRLVEADTNRVIAGQNVQTALDLMAADARQAGENLELDLGISGITFSDAANTLTLRRSIPPLASTGVLLARLPVCASSGTTLQVLGPPPNSTTMTDACRAYTDADNNSEHDNITPWRTYFASQDGRPQAALLYRPGNATTPPLVARTTVRTIGTQTAQTVSGTVYRRLNLTLGNNVPSEFTAANGSSILLVDERRYVLVGTELRLALGGQTDAEAQPVAFDVTDLSLSATLTNPAATVTTMVLNGPWARVKSLSIGMTGGNTGQGRGRARTFEATVFPRNVETARSTSR